MGSQQDVGRSSTTRIVDYLWLHYDSALRRRASQQKTPRADCTKGCASSTGLNAADDALRDKYALLHDSNTTPGGFLHSIVRDDHLSN
jgi:hypothetical protein